MSTANPVSSKERVIILDSLRGFALLGICLANYPEFSLFTFQPADVVTSMPTAAVDRMVRYLLYFLVDGKFYTIFSLLFGIGFSIILANAQKKQVNGFRIFYRRMTVLALFGFVHLMFIWSGDILLLYALVGMLLPLFLKVSNRMLLWLSTILIALPVAIDALCVASGVDLSAQAVKWQWHYCGVYGITEDNFGVWLRDKDSYAGVFQFLIQGAFERLEEFIDGHRALKVMGLFILGYYIGRNRLYANLQNQKVLLRKVCRLGFAIGIPSSLLYAFHAVNGHPAGQVVHSLLYAVSVVPMGLAYVAGFCLLYVRHQDGSIWRLFAAPGRMALSNYIGQSLIGMLLFYGIGFGWGAGIGLVTTEAIACCVFLLQIVISTVWLRFFQFGLLEWFWRMLVYNKWLDILKRGTE